MTVNPETRYSRRTLVRRSDRVAKADRGKGPKNATGIRGRGNSPLRSGGGVLTDQITVGLLPARHHQRSRRSGTKAGSVRDVGRTRVDRRDPEGSERREALAYSIGPAGDEPAETDRTIRPGGHQRPSGAVLRSARLPAEFHLPEPRDVGGDDAGPRGVPAAVRRLLARSVGGWTNAAGQGGRRRQRFARPQLHGLLGGPLGGRLQLRHRYHRPRRANMA